MFNLVLTLDGLTTHKPMVAKMGCSGIQIQVMVHGHYKSILFTMERPNGIRVLKGRHSLTVGTLLFLFLNQSI